MDIVNKKGSDRGNLLRDPIIDPIIKQTTAVPN